MKIKHSYRFYKDNKIWRFTIRYNGILYIGEIKYNIGLNIDGSDGWFIGYLTNSNIQTSYTNRYISFGYSNIHNNVKYILNSMKEVIKVGISAYSPFVPIISFAFEQSIFIDNVAGKFGVKKYAFVLFIKEFSDREMPQNSFPLVLCDYIRRSLQSVAPASVGVTSD